MVKLLHLLAAKSLAVSIVCVLGVSPAAYAQADVAPTEDLGSGSIELGNTGATDHPMSVEGESANVGQPDAAKVSTDAPADPPPKDPREQYRDLVIQASSDTMAGTTAASRRYKKVDMATLRAQAIGAEERSAPATGR